MGRNAERTGRYQAPGDATGNRVEWIQVNASGGDGLHFWGDELEIEFGLEIVEPNGNLTFSFQICDDQRPVSHFWFGRTEYSMDVRQFSLKEGRYRFSCRIPRCRLYSGHYTLTVWLADRRSNQIIETISEVCRFEISMEKQIREEYDWAEGVCVYLEDAEWSAPVPDVAKQ
jgi:lipopolysaccharide transport system ATP-binding protein